MSSHGQDGNESHASGAPPPASSIATAADPAAASAGRAPLSRANILIVDDRPDKLLVFRTILEDLGQNIVSLQSGEEALRWLLDNEAAVILLDVNMPGMDGFETAELIRARRRSAHTPIIFITAHADEILSARGYSLGAVDYLLSPAQPNVLRSKVSAFVQLFDLTRQIRRQADEHVALVREQTARSAAEESTRRANFLAEAGRVMISSLNVDALMAGTTHLLVPELADFCALTVVHDGQTMKRIGAAPGVDEATMTAAMTSDPRLVALCEAAMTSSQQQQLSAVSPDGSPASPFTEVLVLPLLARGQVHGTLVLAMCGSGRTFDLAQLTLAGDVASRAGLALDNSLLFKEIRDNDRRKDEFLATLSHELRNPLAPMRTAIHAMHLAGGWPQGGDKLRAMLERQLDHLTRLVDDLLDVSRITRGTIQLRHERVDLVHKVTYAVDNCRQQIDNAGHTLSLSLPRDPVIVDGDRVRLQQIFENLIINACRYTEPGGSIDVRLTVDDGRARVSIRDTGVGIAPEMMPRIFDMFAQADVSSDRTRHGLGIGLALVRNLVQLHGGSVDARSDGLGHGSEFTITLPVSMDTRATVHAADTESTDAVNKAGAADDRETESRNEPLRILVVDDNTDAAESMSMLLGLLGHEVQIAHDGAGALLMAGTLAPQLVFLDIGLPGMDGYQVAQALREQAGLADGKFIALSGYGTESDKRRSRDAGFVGHLVKPLNPRELPGIIASAFPSR